MTALTSIFDASDFPLLALVLFLPLLGAFINGVFGPRLGKPAVRLMTLSVMGAAFVAALMTFSSLRGLVAASQTVATIAGHDGASHEMIKHDHVRLSWTAWEWMRTSALGGVSVPIDIKFSVDALSGVMMLVITGVGFLIHVYSASYMSEDKAYWRFFAYLNLFVFAMLVLVLADNLPVLFIGWEGVGLCSYLLIGFWYDKSANATAGKKAFLANRVGDFGLLVAMCLLVYYTGALDWAGIARNASNLVSTSSSAQIHLWPIGGGQFRDLSLMGLKVPLSWLQPKELWTISGATAVALMLFLGATGKSAQLPLYVWLPDAMAGPTPVSALIHAATMVTAGVYLICRLSFVFVLSPAVMTIVALTGALTALYAACLALVQNDIKKVLAFSTVSQLGFMFLGVGVGAFTAGFFHVFTHAFFKACLFLGAGSVIHAMHARVHDDTRAQDMRLMGGMRRFMPTTFATFAVSTLAIIGFPLTSGFFSKDEILARVLTHGPSMADSSGHGSSHSAVWTAPSWMPWVLWTMGITAATLTAFYMCRALFMTFFGDFRGWAVAAGGADHVHHASDAHAAHDDHDDDHHHHDDLTQPGAAPAESPSAMTAPLVLLAGAALFAGALNPAALKLFMPSFDAMPMEHWLAPVFESAEHAIAPLGNEHVLHSREWITTVGAFGAFAVGSLVAYWMYIQRKGQLEVAYWRYAMRLASGFSGVVFVIIGAVLLGLAGKDAMSSQGVVPGLLIVGGAWIAFACAKAEQIGFDYVYENSILSGVDALADTATSVDEGFVDLVLGRISALVVAVFGTALRIVQTGVVHVYSAMMVVGLAALSIFFVVPHAAATVQDNGAGEYVVAAGPGFGYKFRWSGDSEAQEKSDEFSDRLTTITVHVDEGATKVVKLEVKNAFSAALDAPVVRALLPHIASREISITRPKQVSPRGFAVGQR